MRTVMLRVDNVIPIYINNRNWLTPLQSMVEYLKKLSKVEIIIIDNDSTYPPLLDYYQQIDVKVIRLKYNGGAYGPWYSGSILTGHEHIARYQSRYYVLTDPDLDLSACPLDLLQVLQQGLEKYDVNKSGLSLRVDDVPEEACLPFWQMGFWEKQLDDQFYDAPVDTTFALYKFDLPIEEARKTEPAIRSNKPYTARHLPWYFTRDNITDEAIYYIENANPDVTHLKMPGVKNVVETKM